MQNRTQISLQAVDSADLLGHERARVQQIAVAGMFSQRLAEQLDTRLITSCLAQQLTLRQIQLYDVDGFALGQTCLAKIIAALFKFPALPEDRRCARLRIDPELAAPDLPIPAKRFIELLALLRDAAQIIAGLVNPSTAVVQALEIFAGMRVITLLQIKQAEGVKEFGILRAFGKQLAELRARFAETFHLHQHL